MSPLRVYLKHTHKFLFFKLLFYAYLVFLPFQIFHSSILSTLSILLLLAYLYITFFKTLLRVNLPALTTLLTSNGISSLTKSRMTRLTQESIIPILQGLTLLLILQTLEVYFILNSRIPVKFLWTIFVVILLWGLVVRGLNAFKVARFIWGFVVLEEISKINARNEGSYEGVTCLAMWLPIMIILELLLTYFRHLKSYRTNKIALTAQQLKSLIYIVSTLVIYVSTIVVFLGSSGTKCLCYAGFNSTNENPTYNKNLILGLTLVMLVVINQVVRDLAVSNVNFQISRYVIESEKLGLGEINAANIQGSFFNLDYCNIMNVLPDHVYYEEGKGWMNEKSEGYYEVLCIGKVYYFRDHGAEDDGCCKMDDSTDEEEDSSGGDNDSPQRFV
ncbi:hypothetical protein TrLO_g11211 [Triparma laevis f. longispina]|uniref:Uncharacterized protein n=1 Tax=Triparma laevis f. longispina TaxID=1714387 RepID=A0A9W7CLP3_9STRA|nr:hypothetical protein TrLO_g11211 [Triparma laevis f. longispina]